MESQTDEPSLSAFQRVALQLILRRILMCKLTLCNRALHATQLPLSPQPKALNPLRILSRSRDAATTRSHQPQQQGQRLRQDMASGQLWSGRV